MKALSIRQPWAWLIVNGYKPVENRTWNTKVRGLILIHASKGFDKAGYAWVRDNFPEIVLPIPQQFERGGIVGIANLYTVRDREQFAVVLRSGGVLPAGREAASVRPDAGASGVLRGGGATAGEAA